MPRAGRAFEEGRIYHVYNRVGGGWMAFDDKTPTEAYFNLELGSSLGSCPGMSRQGRAA